MTIEEYKKLIAKKPRVKGYKRTIRGGRSYHSKKEADFAQILELMKKAGEIKSIKPQKKIRLEVYGSFVANYYIDFEVIHKDNSVEWIEVKGFETEVWRLKFKLVEIIYRDEIRQGKIKLTLVK